MNVVFLILPGLLAMLMSQAGTHAPCGCSPAGDEQKTRWYHDTLDFVDPVRLRVMAGRTVDQNGDPMSDVLIEVFEDKGEGSRRTAACLSATDGRFRMPRLRDGAYELRLSKGGYHAVRYHIQLGRAGRKRGRNALVMTMHVA